MFRWILRYDWEKDGKKTKVSYSLDDLIDAIQIRSVDYKLRHELNYGSMLRWC